jgi:hypothetical protein
VLAAAVMSVLLLSCAFAHANQAVASSGSGAPPVAPKGGAQTIGITRSGSQPSLEGPAEYFTDTRGTS